MPQRLNFIFPNKLIEFRNEYYTRSQYIINYLSDYFDIRIFTMVESNEDLDTDTYYKFDNSVEVIDFFESISRTHIIQNIFKYKNMIYNGTDVDNDLFLILYPYKDTSIFLAYVLRDTKLTIWVKSNFVKQLPIEYRGKIDYTIKKLLQIPARMTFPYLSKRIFEGNLVFYSSGILYDKSNHRTQHSITSLSPLNHDQDLVSYEFQYNLAFVGNKLRRKGLDYLLDSVSELQLGLDIDLHLIGVDEVERNLEGVKIYCHGPIYNKQRFYEVLSMCDFLIMPSVYEKQGKVQIEAMSAGVVPICSDTGGTYKTVNNLYSGYLFEKKDNVQLRNCISLGYSDEEAYSKMVSRCLSTVSEYSIEDQAHKMATIIAVNYK